MDWHESEGRAHAVILKGSAKGFHSANLFFDRPTGSYDCCYLCLPLNSSSSEKGTVVIEELFS